MAILRAAKPLKSTIPNALVPTLVAAFLDERGRIKRLQPEGSEIAGHPTRNFLGRLLEEVARALRAECDPVAADHSPANMRPGAGPWCGRIRIRSADDRPRLLSLCIVPDETNGTTLVLARDVTDTSRWQEHLRLSERLSALSNLCALTCHETSNPLSSVLLNAQLLTQERGIEPHTQAAIRDLLAAAQRLEGFLERLSMVYRPFVSQPKAFPVIELTEEILDALRERVSGSGVRVQWDRAARQACKAWADPAQIQQALWNILVNAIEAVTEGGEIRIRSRRTSWATESRRIWVEWEVEDTGPGIPERDLARVCDPFFTTKPGHMGLGLTMACRLVQENQGLLHIESFSMKGTRCLVFLPAAPEGGG